MRACVSVMRVYAAALAVTWLLRARSASANERQNKKHVLWATASDLLNVRAWLGRMSVVRRSTGDLAGFVMLMSTSVCSCSRTCCAATHGQVACRGCSFKCMCVDKNNYLYSIRRRSEPRTAYTSAELLPALGAL